MIRKLILVTTVLLLQASIAAGQLPTSECKTNHNAPPTGLYAWESDSQVKVYFVRDMFTAEQQQGLLKAMDFWSQAARKHGAGVTFIYGGELDGPSNCISCLTVTRREVYKYDREHYAIIYPLIVRDDELLISARIDLDFAITEPRALQAYMAHELGHGMGLWDCPSCKKKQTIMSGFPGINKDNGLIEPSACDLEVMRVVFESQRRIASNAGNAH